MSLTNITPSSLPLDSDLLRTFLAVLDAGSISAGAERIGRSQSAASLQIKRLEEIIGHTLFDRHGRGIALTPLGEELRDIAQHVVDLLDASLGHLRSEEIAGSLRVGIPDEYGPDVLPAVLASYARHHPNVEVSVRCASSAEFPVLIDRSELDMAVHDVAMAKKRQKILRRQPTVWATSSRHRPDKKSPLPIAVFDRECWWREAAIGALKRQKMEFRIVYESESVAGITAAIESGMAIGAIALSSLRQDFDELSASDGFPKLPQSTLVLETRKGLDQSIAHPMHEAIITAFKGL